MNLGYAEEVERSIAHENAQWTAYAEYPLLFEQELGEAISMRPQRAFWVIALILAGICGRAFLFFLRCSSLRRKPAS